MIDKQKPKRLQICHGLLDRQDDFLDHIISGDETWVCPYNLEMMHQTATSPQPKKFHQENSKVKTMPITFLDIRGILHYKFVPPGQNVKQTYYLDVLKRLLEKVW
jgi:hypothetical protein